MWSAELDGTAHRFRLAGINNQNFLMRDDATGTWWQQSTGEAVMGPLRGRALAPIDFDELTFATWRSENPRGRVLAPVAETLEARRYASPAWEERMATMPVVTPTDPADVLEPRELVVGVRIGDDACAFPLATLRELRALTTDVGGRPVALVVADDGKSVRGFFAEVAGARVDLVARGLAWEPAVVDRATASEWDFTGTAVSGPHVGARLQRLPVLVSYWFDWKQQHAGAARSWLAPPPAARK